MRTQSSEKKKRHPFFFKVVQGGGNGLVCYDAMVVRRVRAGYEYLYSCDYGARVPPCAVGFLVVAFDRLVANETVDDFLTYSR